MGYVAGLLLAISCIVSYHISRISLKKVRYLAIVISLILAYIVIYVFLYSFWADELEGHILSLQENLNSISNDNLTLAELDRKIEKVKKDFENEKKIGDIIEFTLSFVSTLVIGFKNEIKEYIKEMRKNKKIFNKPNDGDNVNNNDDDN